MMTFAHRSTYYLFYDSLNRIRRGQQPRIWPALESWENGFHPLAQLHFSILDEDKLTLRQAYQLFTKTLPDHIARVVNVIKFKQWPRSVNNLKKGIHLDILVLLADSLCVLPEVRLGGLEPVLWIWNFFASSFTDTAQSYSLYNFLQCCLSPTGYRKKISFEKL
jgi:hypothetical protein